ncbi:MAG: YdcF family protein [Hyphomicrobiales bacterium]|nr:YdcF family protein [Hyphomicrobiales bacterium]
MTKRNTSHIYMNIIFFICLGVISLDIISFSKSLKGPLKSFEELVNIDGVVVFTGGENRVQSAIELLSNNIGKRLLISGVNPKTKKIDIFYRLKSDNQLLECCVDLGKNANNTFENATETIQWVNENNFKNLVLVTSNYHMKRSLFILNQMGPNISFIPVHVESSLLRDKKTSLQEKIKTLSIEYLKYMYTRLYFLFQLN